MKSCPDCGNPPESPGSVVTGADPVRGLNADPCDNGCHWAGDHLALAVGHLRNALVEVELARSALVEVA